jgi:sugar lactone lactonase YvrE
MKPITQTRPRSRCVSLALLALAAGACKATEPAPTANDTASATSTPSVQKEQAPPAPRAPAGTVRVLTADATKLQRPTTAAFRGQTLFVSIGQLSALFGKDQKPILPFAALSVNRASGAFGSESVTLPGDDYYPEGIAAAPDGTLYIGSIVQATISKVPASSTVAEPFLKPGVARRGVLGVTVDAPRQLLWFCDTGPKLPDEKKAGELVGVKLSDGSEVARHALSPLDGKAPFCNDVIAGPDGTLWITESAGGRLFRVPAAAALEPNSASVWLAGGEIASSDKGFGANGVEWVDGKLIVANVGRGTLVELDPKSEAPDRGARTLALTDEKTHAPMTLCSPDGVELVPGSKNAVVVVENGGCDSKAPRLVEVTLAANE